MALKKHDSVARMRSEPEQQHTDTGVQVGQWYWVASQDSDSDQEQDSDSDQEQDSDSDQEPWLGCVVHKGSNYFKLEGVEYQNRIHFDNFFARCTYEPDARRILDEEIERRKAKVQALLAEVAALTQRLGINELPEATSTQALAKVGVRIEDHKKALIKAKDKELPALIEAIRQANEDLAKWMKATMIPLQAQARGLHDVLDVLKARIFHVEIYAGLVEQVHQIRDGDPAPASEKLHLFQRRAYMDEECLIDYQAGGMDFRKIEQFDKWLCKKKNLTRLLPFPRCMLAFRVRRDRKWYDEGHNTLRNFIGFFHENNELTFLYIRNGAQVYRLSTAIEFGEKLFPDFEHTQLHGKLYIGRDLHVIDENQRFALHEEYKKKLRQYRRNVKAILNDPELRDEQWDDDLKRYGKKTAIFYQLMRSHTQPTEKPTDRSKEYRPFDQSHIYYDDAMEKLSKRLAEHNRIALVLQGLFDRSPILQPHPKARLWSPEGFDELVTLIYDQDRAVTSGEEPDFEAYRRKCNESLQDGSITVGQQTVWLQAEAEKENERQMNNWRIRNPSDYTYFQPMGNPGPGTLAKVTKFRPRKRQCFYRWERERYGSWRDEGPETTSATFTADAADLLNVDAYKPGDYKQFFDDPRTRAKYLKWAPLLLAAEDYHAGKRKLGGDHED